MSQLDGQISGNSIVSVVNGLSVNHKAASTSHHVSHQQSRMPSSRTVASSVVRPHARSMTSSCLVKQTMLIQTKRSHQPILVLALWVSVSRLLLTLVTLVHQITAVNDVPMVSLLARRLLILQLLRTDGEPLIMVLVHRLNQLIMVTFIVTIR